MASISANGSKGHHKFTLTVTETSTSKENNTSTISYSFELSPITKGYDWANWTNASRTVSYTANVNGKSYTGTIPNYDGSSTVALKSGTQTVSHNTDGTKKISFSFSVTDTTGATYTSGNASANGAMDLTTLERPATGAAPIITASVVDTNSTTTTLTGNSKKLIRYHSNARAMMTAEPQNGAAIDENYYIIRNGSATGYGDDCTFNNVESNVFTFSAEDDRGYVGTATVTADMINYVRLTCNIANGRPDADGDMYLYCSGNYFNGSFGAQSNSLTVNYSYIGSDGKSGNGNMVVSKSGNTYTAYANVSGLNYQATYSFAITATDKLETVTSTKSAVKSKPAFHWGANDFTFEVPVDFKGGLSGSTISSGTWTPTLTNTGAVSSYTVRQGWYQKLGNVVTIGWQIKANIRSGYDAYRLVIEGVPFTPKANAFGGGVAHNICIVGGHNFEGWCVDTSCQIIARTQPCNNASTGNLEIGSSSSYPINGGTVTLAGTICYMV